MNHREKSLTALRTIGIKGDRGPCSRILGERIRSSIIGSKGDEPLFRADVLDDASTSLARMGMTMENVTLAAAAACESAAEMKQQLQETSHDLAKIESELVPELVEYVRRLRDARMSVASETRASLTALKEVRQFFLESDYVTEVQRLREFHDLLKGLIELAKSGALESVTDAMVKLALKS